MNRPRIRVLHQLPGRVRLSLDPYPPDGALAQVRRLPGILAATGNALTGTWLLRVDPALWSTEALLEELAQRLDQSDRAASSGEADSERPGDTASARSRRVRVKHAVTRQVGTVSRRRLRLAVPGLEGNPHLALAIEDALGRLGAAVVRASALTGRVLVELDESIDLSEVIASIAGLDLPELPPSARRVISPFDQDLLTYGIVRSTGTALALGLLVARQLLGRPAALTTSPVPSLIADALTVLRGFPTLREGMRRLLTPIGADIATSSLGIVTQALAGQRIGLLVSFLEALRLLTVLLPWQRAWQRYERQLAESSLPHPGAPARVSPGSRLPLPAVLEDGELLTLSPAGTVEHRTRGQTVSAGSFVLHGQATIRSRAVEPVTLWRPRPTPLPALTQRYLDLIAPLALGAAAVNGLRAGSLAAAGRALVLLNARPALIGTEMADLGAVARALRAGTLVTCLAPGRRLVRPSVIVLDHPLLLSDGFELDTAISLDDALSLDELLECSARLALEQRLPFASALPLPTNGRRNGLRDWRRFELTGANGATHPVAQKLLERGSLPVLLCERGCGRVAGVIALRPRLSAAGRELVSRCRQQGIRVLVRGAPDTRLTWLEMVGVEVLADSDPAATIAGLRRSGQRVFYVADHLGHPSAFREADLGIGLQPNGVVLDYPVDVLASDLAAVMTLLDIGERRDQAVRDTTLVSLASNLAALALGFALPLSPTLAAILLGGSALLAIVLSWMRLWGQPPSSVAPVYVDPEPERWGDRAPDELFREFATSPHGLSASEALRRLAIEPSDSQLSPWVQAALEQLSSPLVAIMAAGAALSLAVNAPLDVLIIVGTIAVNTLLGTWQDVRVARATSELARLTETTARVRRDGDEQLIPASELVPGDIVLLHFGDLVPADARLIETDNFAVDESALTGESIPVQKDAAARDERAVVLAGSAVVSGTAAAIVVATGSRTRLGALRRSLELSEEHRDHLTERLAQYTRLSLPISFATAAAVTLSGILRGLPPAAQLGLGASLAIAAVPEGLPLLSRVAQAATARRLARNGIVVRRLSAVEALGRVSIVCVDKTGTLTAGKLSVTHILTRAGLESLPGQLSELARRTLTSAALASPAPSRSDAFAHGTDAAVLRAALEAGLRERLDVPRDQELPFESTQPYHAVRIGDIAYFKGSPEVLLDRCRAWLVADGSLQPLDDARHAELADHLLRLAGAGLRVLLVAEADGSVRLEDPTDLRLIGFLGLSDPLRPTVPDAVARCRRAGVCVVMITGDHPATASTIARAAGLTEDERVITGADLASLSDEQLAERLEQVPVIARATPLDKVRIVRALQARGHVVAMTGDGVNDSAALRLADVGMAMGWGTEVARQAADLILIEDDFAALVQALIEGRSFWRNMRRAVALLLGGNLGELLLMGIPSLLGAPAPLNTRQVLMVNLITDVPPALAIALQGPRYQRLEQLAREGETALDRPLRVDVLRRAGATAVPAALAYLWAMTTSPSAAPAVAFTALVAGQLAQTLELGLSGAGLTPSLLTGTALSSAVLVATLITPPFRALLGLPALTPAGWLAAGLSTVAAVAASQAIAQLVPTEAEASSPSARPAPISQPA